MKSSHFISGNFWTPNLAAFGFYFKPSDETPVWKEKTGLEFINQFPEFAKQHYRVDSSSPVQAIERSKFDDICSAYNPVREVSGVNEECTDILAVGGMYLSYQKLCVKNNNACRAKIAYDLDRYYQRYRKFWKPDETTRVLMMVQDIIVLSTDEKINDYFNLYVRTPESLGELTGFECTVSLAHKESENVSTSIVFKRSKLYPPHVQAYDLTWLFPKDITHIDDLNSMWALVESLHNFYTKTVYSCLTCKGRRLYTKSMKDEDLVQDTEDGKIICIGGSDYVISWASGVTDTIDIGDCSDDLAAYKLSEDFRADTFRTKDGFLVKLRNARGIE
jgi:hypothetical protein